VIFIICVLGLDFLSKMQASINLGKGVIRLVKGVKLTGNPPEQGPSQDGGRQHRKRKKRRPEQREASLDFSLDYPYGFGTTNLSRKWPSTPSTSPGKRKSLRKVNGRAKESARSSEVRGNRGLVNSCAREPELSAVNGSKDLSPPTE
jgi:hypothetical protein